MTEPVGPGSPLQDRYGRFPDGFFARMDDGSDGAFYRQPRLVTHIDDQAIDSVGDVYEDLEIRGRVLDLMSSWVSHFRTTPEALIVAGMNGAELAANRAASGAVVVDLNTHQGLPFADESFDGATCCVSVDYLTNPLEVFDEVARVLRPGSPFCTTFSNRCFPTKVIQGWAQTDDRTHVAIVSEYFRLSGPWTDPSALSADRTAGGGDGTAGGGDGTAGGGDGTAGGGDGTAGGGDPLYAVWARRA